MEEWRLRRGWRSGLLWRAGSKPGSGDVSPLLGENLVTESVSTTAKGRIQKPRKWVSCRAGTKNPQTFIIRASSSRKGERAALRAVSLCYSLMNFASVHACPLAFPDFFSNGMLSTSLFFLPPALAQKHREMKPHEVGRWKSQA